MIIDGCFFCKVMQGLIAAISMFHFGVGDDVGVNVGVGVFVLMLVLLLVLMLMLMLVLMLVFYVGVDAVVDVDVVKTC